MVGHPVNRFTNLSESEKTNLNCSVCLNIFKNPIKNECEHTFCKSCLKECIIKGKHKSCPECRNEFQARKRTAKNREDPNIVFIDKYMFKRNLMANGFLDKLKTKCNYESNGCQEVVEFGSLSSHLKECLHRICSKCGFTLGRVEDHNCVQLLISDNKRLKQELNQCLNQFSSLKEVKNNNNELNDKISKLESQLVKQKTRKKQLNALELKYKSVSEINKQLENRLSKHQQMVENFEELTQNNSKLELEFKSIASQLKTRENQSKDLKSKYESLLEINKQLNNDLVKEVNTSKLLKDRLLKEQHLVNSFEDLNKNNSKLESQLKSVSSQLKTREKEFKDFKWKYERLLETNKQLNNDLEHELNISNHLEERLSKHQKLVNSCEDLTQNNSKLESELKNVCSQLKTRENESKKIKSNYERLLETNKQLDNRLTEVFNTCNQLEDRLSTEQQLVKNFENSSQKNLNLESDLKRISSQLKNNQKITTDLKTKYEIVLETNKQLDNDLVKEVKTCQQLRTDFKILSDKYSPLESKLDIVSKNRDFWREKHNNLFLTNEESKKKLLNQEWLNRSCKELLKANISKLQTELQTNEKTINEWKDKYKNISKIN